MKKAITFVLSVTLTLSAGAFCGCTSTENTGASSQSESADPAVEEEDGEADTAALSGDSGTETEESEASTGELSEACKLLNDTLTEKEVNIYTFTIANEGTCNLAFADDEEEVPYISLSDAVDFMNSLLSLIREEGMESDATGFAVELDEDTSTAAISKANGSFVLFNWETNVMDVANVDNISFLQDTAGDMIRYSSYGTDEKVFYLRRNENANNVSREGYGFEADLDDDYGIRLYYQDEDVYIPLALFNDIFIGSGIEVIYNGADLFVTTGTPDQEVVNVDEESLYDIYYSKEPSERSEALSAFTYSELCLYLDIMYGLKSTHGITNFNQYFIMTGLSDELTSTDPQVFDTALAKLVYSYFNDLHSVYYSNSAYTGKDFEEAEYWDEDNDCARYQYMLFLDEINSKRREAGLIDEENSVIDGYMEVGNTAYVTFDSFKTPDVDPDRYYYMVTDDGVDMDVLSPTYMNDTMGLVIYANQMINREDSPIENVVIDLSANGGGAVDAAAYITAWVLGDAQINNQNQASGASYSFTYNADVDLDGKITENDSLDLDRLNVYCLESSLSFSCGNLVPAMFKSSGKVTLIGQKSAGGSCAVQLSAAADGTIYRISSNADLCTVSNGSFYSVDQGIEPDIYIKHLEKLYDREWLTDYINNID